MNSPASTYTRIQQQMNWFGLTRPKNRHPLPYPLYPYPHLTRRTIEINVSGYHRRRDDLVTEGLSVWRAMAQAHSEWRYTSESRWAA
jgi:hypothetical protein